MSEKHTCTLPDGVLTTVSKIAEHKWTIPGTSTSAWYAEIIIPQMYVAGRIQNRYTPVARGARMPKPKRYRVPFKPLQLATTEEQLLAQAESEDFGVDTLTLDQRTDLTIRTLRASEHSPCCTARAAATPSMEFVFTHGPIRGRRYRLGGAPMIASGHLALRVFECTECGKTFARGTGLKTDASDILWTGKSDLVPVGGEMEVALATNAQPRTVQTVTEDSNIYDRLRF